MENRYFPMYVDLSGQKVVIVGAGKVASRRAKVLSLFTDDILVIALDFCKKMRLLESEQRVKLMKKSFEEEDIRRADLVIAATNDHTLNENIGSMCRRRKTPVNVADNPELCDFYFPGIVTEEELVIGISSGGKSPERVKRIRQDLETYILKK